MNRKHIIDFLQWLDYEQFGEIYLKWTLKEFEKSHRIFDNKFGVLLKDLGFETYLELLESDINA